MKNIFSRIKSSSNRNYGRVSSLLNLSKVLPFILLFAFIPTGEQPLAKEQNQTRLQFNQASPTPLMVKDKKIEIVSAGSRQDLDNLKPEAIKGLMKVYSEQYDVDWKLVYAIGYHESGNYSSSLARRQNNFFGRKSGAGGYASWNSPEDAIRNQFEYLKTRYFDRGLDTPQKINRVYAEDQSWYFAVQSVMSQL